MIGCHLRKDKPPAVTNIPAHEDAALDAMIKEIE